MKNRELRHILELYNQKRFSKIENIPFNKMLKIDSEEVTKVIKKNYSYLTCTCQSSGKTGHGSLCRHKQFFIVFPILKFFYENLDNLINYYKFENKLRKEVDSFMVLDDLKKLRRVK